MDPEEKPEPEPAPDPEPAQPEGEEIEHPPPMSEPTPETKDDTGKKPNWTEVVRAHAATITAATALLTLTITIGTMLWVGASEPYLLYGATDAVTMRAVNEGEVNLGQELRINSGAVVFYAEPGFEFPNNGIDLEINAPGDITRCGWVPQSMIRDRYWQFHRPNNAIIKMDRMYSDRLSAINMLLAEEVGDGETDCKIVGSNHGNMIRFKEASKWQHVFLDKYLSLSIVTFVAFLACLAAIGYQLGQIRKLKRTLSARVVGGSN